MAQVPNGPSSLWPKVLWPQFARPEEKVLREVKFWEGSQPVCDKSVSPNKQGGKIGLGKIQFPRKIKSLKGNSSPSRSKKETCLSNKSLKAIKILSGWKLCQSWRPTFKKLKSNPSLVRKWRLQFTRNSRTCKQFYISSSLLGQVNSSTFRPVCWANKSSGASSSLQEAIPSLRKQFQVSRGKISIIQVSNIKSFWRRCVNRRRSKSLGWASVVCREDQKSSTTAGWYFANCCFLMKEDNSE